MNVLSLKDEFELREKRLKLAYKISYVAAALWAALFLSLPSAQLNITSSAIYSFLLSTLSLCIINIAKYALHELSCMKITGSVSSEDQEKAEKLFITIWRHFSIILAMSAFLMVMSISFPAFYNATVIVWVLSLSCVYFAGVTLPKQPPAWTKGINVLVSIAAAYSIFSILCITVMQQMQITP